MPKNNRSVDRLSGLIRGDEKDKEQDPAFEAFNSGGDISEDALANLQQFASQRTVEKISINRVWPDPTQPRRAVPTMLRSLMPSPPDRAFFERWAKLASDERAVAMTEPIDLKSIVAGTSPIEDDDRKLGPLESDLIELARLAQDVRSSGLTNPITVAQLKDGNYMIETGERRWLAFSLLHSYYPNGDFDTIPATVQDSVDVWRQASENNARQNLNAVGKARQLSLLLMHLLYEDGGVEFQPITSFEHERDFYAQVADGSKYRIPHGSAERLLAATGLRNSSQLRNYRRILTLGVETWDKADDEDWTEGRIRKALEKTQTSEVYEESAPVYETTGDPEIDAVLLLLQKMSNRKRQEILKRFRDTK